MNLCQAHNRSVKMANKNPLALLCHFEGSLDDSSGNNLEPDWSLQEQTNAYQLQAYTGYPQYSKFGTGFVSNPNVVTNTFVDVNMLYDTRNADLSGPFTLDGWLSVRGASSTTSVACQIGIAGHILFGVWYYSVNNNGVTLFVNGLDRSSSFSSIRPFSQENTYRHFAVTRDANNILRCFIDGTVGHSETVTGTMGQDGDEHSGKARVRIGRYDSVFGRVDELRLLAGVCAWDCDFTPPTEAYTGHEVYE